MENANNGASGEPFGRPLQRSSWNSRAELFSFSSQWDGADLGSCFRMHGSADADVYVLWAVEREDI